MTRQQFDSAGARIQSGGGGQTLSTSTAVPRRQRPPCRSPTTTGGGCHGSATVNRSCNATPPTTSGRSNSARSKNQFATRTMALTRLLCLVYCLLTILLLPTPVHSVEGETEEETELQANLTAKHIQNKANGTGVGASFTTTDCYEPLLTSDENNDRELNATEYVTYLNTVSQNKFPYATGNFEKLPINLKAVFNFLACLCDTDFGEGSQCCEGDNAHIDTNGAAFNENPDTKQTVYLFTVCKFSFEAVDEETRAPTPNPTMMPSVVPSMHPSSMPSLRPTGGPSAVPSTSPPTLYTGDLVVATSPFQISNSANYEANDVKGNFEVMKNLGRAMDVVFVSVVEDLFDDEAGKVEDPTAPRISGGGGGGDSGSGRTGDDGSEDYGGGGYRRDVPVDDTDEGGTAFGGRTLRNVGGGNRRRSSANGGGGGGESKRRFLAVTAEDGSCRVDGVVDSECPEGTSINVLCQDVTTSCTLIIQSEDPNRVKSTVQQSLDDAIADGQFNAALRKINPNTVLTTPSAVRAAAPTPSSTDDTVTGTGGGLGTGAMIGIVAGCIFAVAGASIGMFVTRRNRRRKRELEAGGPQLSSLQDMDADEWVEHHHDGNDRQYYNGSVLGATSPTKSREHLPKRGVRGFATLDDGGSGSGSGSSGASDSSSSGRRGRGASVAADASYDSSSNAGSSGWSSSAGLSSMNSGTIDSLDFLHGGKRTGPSLASIALGVSKSNRDGEMSNKNSSLQFVSVKEINDGESPSDDILKNVPSSSDNSNVVESGSVPNLPAVTRSDLDLAIEAGDWAAVGATAALLASIPDSVSSDQKTTSSSRGSSSVSSSWKLSTIDAARARELDELVDSGDWEGVVFAAAQFEAADELEKGNNGGEGGGGSGSGEQENDSESMSDDRTGASGAGDGGSVSIFSDPTRSTQDTRSVDISSVASPGASTAISESPSRAQKRAEIRSEVEALVRRVVPDEIENVDEMMIQFRGREEELVETLRTMQERSIAARARAAVHRSAKLKAKKARLEKGLPPTMPKLNGMRLGSRIPRPPAGTEQTSSSPLSKESNGTMTPRAGGGRGAASAVKVLGAGTAAGVVATAAALRDKKNDETKKDTNGDSSLAEGAEASGVKPPIHLSAKLEESKDGVRKIGVDDNDSVSDSLFSGLSSKGPTEASSPTEDGGDGGGGGGDSVFNGLSTGADIEATGGGRTEHPQSSAAAAAASRKSADRTSLPPSGPNRDTGTKNDGGKQATREQQQQQKQGLAGGGADDESEAQKSALEMAIEAGDWDAVSEAAAKMTDIIDYVSESQEPSSKNLSAGSGVAGPPPTTKPKQENDATSPKEATTRDDRSTELERMIRRGDWSGVVATANRYSAMDKENRRTNGTTASNARRSGGGGNAAFGQKSANTRPLFRKSTSASDSVVSNATDASSVLDEAKALEEEKDALAQAEIWMAIAEQSRQGNSSETQGASDAADWAISRSLTALRSAEQKGDLSSSEAGGGGNGGSGSSNVSTSTAGGGTNGVHV